MWFRWYRQASDYDLDDFRVSDKALFHSALLEYDRQISQKKFGDSTTSCYLPSKVQNQSLLVKLEHWSVHCTIYYDWQLSS